MTAEKLLKTERLVVARELEVVLEAGKSDIPIDFEATFLGTEVLRRIF
jgi:hypothetical protein